MIPRNAEERREEKGQKRKCGGDRPLSQQPEAERDHNQTRARGKL